MLCEMNIPNISRIRRADSPMYLSTIALETTLRKLQSSVLATARASSVFPVPWISKRYGRTVEKHTLGWFDSDPDEQFRVKQRQLDNFTQFTDLVTQSTNPREGDVAWIFGRHVINEGIDFTRQHAHDCKCSHIKRYTGALDQFSFIDSCTASYNVSWTARCFHNDWFRRVYIVPRRAV
jgi:hypothetical protein